MAQPQIEALRSLIEQQTTLADPAERDRALADIEGELETMIAAVETYRGDAQNQMGVGVGDGQQPKSEQPEQQPTEQQPEQSEPKTE